MFDAFDIWLLKGWHTTDSRQGVFEREESERTSVNKTAWTRMNHTPGWARLTAPVGTWRLILVSSPPFLVWYPFSLSARNRPHRIVRMRILILKIAYSWYSLPNSLFYSEFLLNVVHSLAFGWGKSSSLPNLPKRRYSLKQ